MNEGKEIVEGNKLIDHFYTGRIVIPNTLAMGRERGMPIQHRNYYDISHFDELHYHDSWDKLMPVVEKIVRCLPKDTKENKYIQSSVKIGASMASGYPYHFIAHCRIGDLMNGEQKFYISKGGGADAKDASLIICVWLAVVEFIKWYSAVEQSGFKNKNLPLAEPNEKD